VFFVLVEADDQLVDGTHDISEWTDVTLEVRHPVEFNCSPKVTQWGASWDVGRFVT